MGSSKPVGNLVISLRLTPADRARLEELSAKLGIPYASVIRYALSLCAELHRGKDATDLAIALMKAGKE